MMKHSEEIPSEENFYMPAEWAPHTCTWMALAGLVSEVA